jgi:putative tryptophan/tyrosine transport system substrate-binding protein
MLDQGRRDFIGLLGGAAAWPLAAQAQQPKPPIIGYMISSTAETASRWTAAFLQRLRELGWIDGRTVVIEYWWAEGRIERFSEIVAEFVRLRVDVIVTSGSAAVTAAKQATSTIPIVFTAAVDPVGSGLVTSLARPGNNVTGLSLQQSDLAGKRLELLREVVPTFRRLAILANIGNAGAAAEMGEAQTAAEKLGLQVVPAPIRRAEDIAPTFEAVESRADALDVCGDALANTYQTRIGILALGLRLPTIFPNREYVQTGGLMSYGPSFPDLWRRSGDMSTRYCAGQSPPHGREIFSPRAGEGSPVLASGAAQRDIDKWVSIHQKMRTPLGGKRGSP